MSRLVSAAVVLLLAACSPRAHPIAGDNQAAPTPPAAAEVPQVDEAALAGSWRIITVDDAAPRALREDGGEDRTPFIAFSRGGYGGTSGCNFFGGLGLAEGGRYYAVPGPSTLIGCGDLTRQEDAIHRVIASGPELALAADTLTISGQAGRLVLRRAPDLDQQVGPEPAPPRALIGTSWRIMGLDGQWFDTPPAASRTIAFQRDGWTGSAACATLGAGWRQEGDRIVPVGSISTTEQLCPPEQAEVDAKLAALMRAGPRFVAGPNGEILIAGGGHWLTGHAR